MSSDSTGLFGKLPGHGDFIHRNLPTKVINEWDSWLQTFIGSTQERLGEAWLEVYLTSPIWRFCLAQGVVDDHNWAGILLPSVDRVGRYFPFLVLRKLPANVSLCEFMETEKSWFEAVEAAALRALDGQMQTDQLLLALNQAKLSGSSAYLRQGRANLDAGVVVDMDFDESSTLVTMPHLLEAFVASTYSSYSVWSTEGSERVEPCVFVTHGMPPVAGAAALMDGLWEHWEWSVPVRPLIKDKPPETQTHTGDEFFDE